MGTESIVDEVQARLAADRPERGMSEGMDTDGFGGPVKHGLEIEDLNVIVSRHFYAGRFEGTGKGFERGMKTGILAGRSRQRVQDARVSRAVTTTVTDRLSRIWDELAPVPDGSQDRRTKTELRERALALVGELRAGVAVLAVKVAAGEFDDDE